jgi:competence protein ComEA
MQGWRKQLVDFFHYARKERKGVVALSLILAVLVIVPQIIRSFQQQDFIVIEKEVIDGGPPVEQTAIPAKLAGLPSIDTFPDIARKEVVVPVQERRLFHFDPNKATEEELLQLGFPKKAASNLLRYREKGGVFRYQEDLKKIYGLPEKVAEELEFFVELPQKRDPNLPVRILINQATAEEWTALRGVGPYYAKQITAFREKLGGFISIDQVGETWALPDSVFQKIKPHLQLQQSPKQIVINRADFTQLVKHPYINKKQAKVLSNFLEHNSPITEPDALYQLEVFDSSEVRRLLPYFSFD